MIILGMLCMLAAGIYTVYALIECEIRAVAPQKECEPSYQFKKVVQEEEKDPETVVKLPDIVEETESTPTDREKAKEWIKKNADLITEMTKPSYEERSFCIKNQCLEVSDEVKQEIVLILLEVYAAEIKRAGIDGEGNISGELNN